MEEWRVKLGIIGMVAMLAIWGIFTSAQQRAINSTYEESLGDRYSRHPEEFPAAFRENEKNWQVAIDLMKKGKYPEAYQTYGTAASFEYEMSGSAEKEINPGEKAKEVFRRHQEAFSRETASEFEKVTGQAVNNPLQSGSFLEFFHLFRDASPEVKRLYASKKNEVVGARIREAGKWFRLAFSVGDATYAKPLEAALKEKWNKNSGKILVFGDYLDPSEAAATWMTLEMNFRETGASYEVKDARYKRQIAVKVPESVTVSFQLKKRIPIPTTWDGLKPIVLFEKAPEVIRGESGGISATVQEVADRQKEKLAAQLPEKLTAIPPFQLYPGRNAEAMSLLAGNRIDREAARVLGAVDPNRLAREALAISRKNDPFLTRELLETAIEQDLDILGEWAAQQIEASSETNFTKILGLLKVRPSFGGFKAVLAILKKTTAAPDQIKIFEILQKYLYEEEVHFAFLRVITDRRNPLRIRIGPLFFRNLPPQRLQECTVWLKDPDPAFANQVYSALNRSDSPLKDQTFGLMLVGSPPETQMRMLSDFHYSEKKHGIEIIEKLKTVYLSSSHSQVKEKILEKLMASSHTLAGWKALEELSHSITDPRMLPRIKENLAANINQADPEMAGTYQMTAILSGTPKEQVAAAGKYFRDKEGIDEKLQSIVPHLPRLVSADRFFEALLRGFSEQGMSRLSDPKLPELRTMIGMAVAHKDRMVRYFGYSLCHRAWSKGATEFHDILRDGLTNETDSWAKDKAQGYLKAMSKR